MDYQLKPQPLIAQVLPGLFSLATLSYFYYSHDPDWFTNLRQFEGGVKAILGVSFFFAAWILGTFFDAIRNILEDVVDWLRPATAHWWDVFFKADRGKVDQLQEYYFAYYELDGNFAIANVFLLFCTWWFNIASYSVLLVFLAVALIFFWDAIKLRRDLERLAAEELARLAPVEVLPHVGVYTRLQPSQIHGIGVFAITDIPKGTPLFETDDGRMVWIDRTVTFNLPPETRRLYEDFGVLIGGRFGCPTTFNKLTVGWYINDARPPLTPN